MAHVLDLLAVRPARTAVLKDIPSQNGSWLVEMPGGQRTVLRRYHSGASPEDLALRDLGQRIGQRPGWRPQHSAITVHVSMDWQAGLRQLTAVSPRLSAWAQAAARRTRATLASIGAGELPTTVIHGDLAEWNVHYQQGRLAGVIDFGLTHQDSRPYELAIARTHRAPEAADAYRDELARGGWPLSALEEAAIRPLYHAFRLDMVAWELGHGLSTGEYNLATIERQLSRTGTPPP